MAEVAASLIGIATFGVKLTTTLYEFGADVASAREQTDRIARHLQLYSDVLEVLVERIDDTEPIHSAKALDLVDEIYDQSYDLFDKIRDLMPNKGERMSFLRKITWNFKKSRVALVVSEIEYLKSTVTLLVTVLFAGKRIRFSRRRKKLKKDSKEDREELDFHCAKVKNAIVEQINASNQKLNMQVKVEEEESMELAPGQENVERGLTTQGTGILQNSMELVNFRKSLGRTKDVGEERTLVLSHSFDLIERLLDQWTTLADDVLSPSASLGYSNSGNLGTPESPQDDQTLRNTPHRVNHQPREDIDRKDPSKRQEDSLREETHREMLTEAYLDVRNRAERAEEELARLKASLQHHKSSPKTKVHSPHNTPSTSESDEERPRPKASLQGPAESATLASGHSLAKFPLTYASLSKIPESEHLRVSLPADICGSDSRNIRESLEEEDADSVSEFLFYNGEAQTLRDEFWHHDDDINLGKWGSLQKTEASGDGRSDEGA